MTTSRDYELNSGALDDERRVPINEARANLSAVVKLAAERDIVLTNHGRAAAILMSPEHYQALLDEIDELEDRLSVHEARDAPGVSADIVAAELGLSVD